MTYDGPKSQLTFLTIFSATLPMSTLCATSWFLPAAEAVLSELPMFSTTSAAAISIPSWAGPAAVAVAGEMPAGRCGRTL